MRFTLLLTWMILLAAGLSPALAQDITVPAADPTAAERLTKMGLALGDHSAEEFNYYVAALEADPRHAPARIHLGAWLRAHQRHDEALRQYLAALAAAPDLPIAHFALAEFLWHEAPDPAAAEGPDPRYEIKPSVRRLELARYHLQRYLDLVGESDRAFHTEARIMLASMEGDLAAEKGAEPLSRVAWDEAARRLSRPADPSLSPYEGPRLPLAIEFTRGSSAITHGSTYLLDAVARALSSEPLNQATIMIEGHADSEGDSQRNLDLSKRRAQSVRDYFIARGVPAERFLLSAFGEERPLVPNDTAQLRQMNRRIEVVNWNLVQQTRRNRGQVAARPAATPPPAQNYPAAQFTPAPLPQPTPIDTFAPFTPAATPTPEAISPGATPSGWEIYQFGNPR